jgi:drug/metabolite transporter (DMT)-like permease
MQKLLDVLLFIGYALCSGSGLVILKIALNDRAARSLSLIEALLQIKFLVGFLLYAAGFLLWMLILSRFKLNVAFPIAMSFFFIVSGLGSYLVIKESFSLIQVIGILLCLAGIVLINLK